MTAPLVTALTGRRIVVTRSRHQAERFATALEARGAIPVFFPTIMTRPVEDMSALDAAIRTLTQFEWIVFTSANAVTVFFDRMRETGARALPPALCVASVGPATREALERRGARVDAQPERYSGSEVAGAIAKAGKEITGSRVLLPRAEHAREETAAALRAAGATVNDLVAYHTEIDQVDDAAVDAVRAGVDALTFTSPSCVRGFSVLFGTSAAAVAAATVLATIGPATSAAVRELGWHEPLESLHATTDGIIAALEAHFGSAVASGGGSARGARGSK